MADTDIIPLIAPKPDSHHSPSKLLSPLQVNTVNSTHPAEKAPTDMTTKPTKMLPKLNPPKMLSSFQSADPAGSHLSTPPKLDPHPAPSLTLTPLSDSPALTHTTTLPIQTALPSHSNSTSPNLAPLSTSIPNISPEKLDIDALGDSNNNRKPPVRRISLDPLPVPLLPEYDATEHNGTVTLLYELYQEKFNIKNGTITEDAINDTYGLSDVMPNCRLRLSISSPAELREAIISVAENNGADSSGSAVLYLPEQPEGTFCHLRNDHSYYVYADESEEQLLKEQAARRQKKIENTDEHKIERDDGRGFDSCTCIYGTPCVDEYGCRDWSKRYDIATANGWAGFQSSNE